MSKVFIAYNSNDFQWVQYELVAAILRNDIEYIIDQNDFKDELTELLNIKGAMEQADMILFVLSEDFVENDWEKYETALAEFGDKFGDEHSIINVFIKKCKPPRKLLEYKYFDLIGGKYYEKDFNNLINLISRQLKRFVNRKEGSEYIFMKNVAELNDCFVGRSKDLKFIDHSIDQDYINVLSVYGQQGIGKSSLVYHWMENFRAREDYFEKIFVWSFYGESYYEDQEALIDEFYADAFKFFEYYDKVPKNPWDKGKLLAKIIRQKKVLLILDGIDGLQSLAGKNPGEIKSRAMFSLLNSLVQSNPGLCIVTSQYGLSGFNDDYLNNIQKYRLEQISPEAGIELLKHYGVTGTDEEFRNIVFEYACHPLALTLLAGLIVTFYDGSLSYSYRILKSPGCESKNTLIIRLIRSIEQNLEGKAEQNYLRILGLFDGPIAPSLLKICLEKPDVEGFNNGLSEHERDIDAHLKVLEKLNVIRYTNDKEIFVHPLVIKNLNILLKEEWADAAATMFNRFYKYYKALPGDKYPETMEELFPLLKAVKYGCLAGKHQEVYNNVYLKKITRKNQYFVIHKLNGHGPFISAVSNYFDTKWSRVSLEIKDNNRSSILGSASYVLKILGRHREAAQTMQAGLDAQIKIEDWKDAAINAESISDLYLMLGEVNTAKDFAHMSLDFADLSGDVFHRWSKRCTYANALFQEGKIAESEEQYRKAEEILRLEDNNYILYGMAGFNYCNLLLSKKRFDEVIVRTRRVLDWMGDDYWQLGKSLDWLTMGKAYIIKTEKDNSGNYDEAITYLNKSLEVLSAPGNEDYLPLVLFAKAEVFRHQQAYKEAHNVLNHIKEITEKGGMLLHLIDYHLELARLLYAEGNNSESKQQFIISKELVERTGYFRRYPELKVLKDLLLI